MADSTSVQAWYDLLNLLCSYDVNMTEFKRLLDTRKADLNHRDNSGRTLLDYCALTVHSYQPFDENILSKPDHHYITCANLLLQYGANPNVTDKQGWSIIHQCAMNGNLTLLQLCVRRGANVYVRNKQGQLPIDLALMKGHTPLLRYLEVQSGDLRSFCRLAIREAMGPRSYNRINELPLPSSMKLFVNYGNPFCGWVASIYIPRPWTEEEVLSGNVKEEEVKEFIEENASEEFIEEKSIKSKQFTPNDLADVLASLYFWEAFKTIEYEEPLPRKPNYSMEKLSKEKREMKTEEKRYLDFLGIGRNFFHK